MVPHIVGETRPSAALSIVSTNLGVKRKRERFEKYEEEAFGPNGIFSTKDMRPLWGSFGEYDFSKVWNAYHENETKYNRLREQRGKHDPNEWSLHGKHFLRPTCGLGRVLGHSKF